MQFWKIPLVPTLSQVLIGLPQTSLEVYHHYFQTADFFFYYFFQRTMETV